MVPSTVQDIFGTLSVGIFAAAVGLILWWIFEHGSEKFSLWVRTRFFTPTPNPSFLAVLFLLLFGFGIIVENLTDHLTDSEKEYTIDWSLTGFRNLVPKCQSELLGPEGHHRYRTFFRHCETEALANCELRSLGKVFFGRHQLHLAELAAGNEPFGLFVENPLDYLNGKSPGVDPCFAQRKKKATEFVNQIYYASKNWSYMQSTLYDELQSIQRQIEYTRSSFLIATWGVLLIGVSCLVGRCWHRRLGRKGPYPWREQLRRAFGGAVIFTTIAMVACMGYGHTEINFNERALGYHASFLDRQRIDEVSPPQAGLLANQWMQTSAEYTALSIQTFNFARNVVKDALMTNPVDHRCRDGVVELNDLKLCPAVVLDLDETVIDNGAFQGYLLREGLAYTSTLWNAWIRDGIAQMELVPQAGEFIEEMEELGVTVIFISNRPNTLREREATIETLATLGVDSRGLADPNSLRLLLKAKEGCSKEARRQLVKKRYRIIAIIGDSLGDFAGEFDPVEGMTIDSRRKNAMDAKEKWGTKWLVLPNPTYGSWQRVLDCEKPSGNLRKWERRTRGT